MKTPIFNYQDYRHYLSDRLLNVGDAAENGGEGGEKKLSIRAWSRHMGFKAPSHLVMILQGKRRLQPRHIPTVIRVLKLKTGEAQYFENLVYFKNAKTLEEKTHYERKLKQLHGGTSFKSLDMESFRLIADPLHYFIVEMTGLKDFRFEGEWLRRRLGSKYSLTQIREAMDRLVSLGLLKLEEGKVTKTSPRYTTTHDVPNAALKEFHRTLIAKASAAIDTQGSSERDISSATFSVDTSRILEAKEVISEFRRSFSKQFEAAPGSATETYQLNIQLFRITKGEDHESP